MRLPFLLLALLAACTTQASMRRQVLAEVARVDSLLPTVEAALVRILEAPAACRSLGGVNPMPRMPDSLPRAGSPFQVVWATRAGGVPIPPSAECWMITTYGPPRPVDFSHYGAPGCWLMVPLDQIVWVPTNPGGLLWRDGGHIFFEWTPPEWAIGTHLIMQLLVQSDGENRAGWLLSPAVEIVVGAPL